MSGKKADEALASLLEKYEGKQGVREKVAEVLSRYSS